jgi:hypothetical protein
MQVDRIEALLRVQPPDEPTYRRESLRSPRLAPAMRGSVRSRSLMTSAFPGPAVFAAVAVVALVLVLGSSTTSTPSASASPSPSPTETPSATVPPTTCHNDAPEWWAQWTTTSPDGTKTPVAITLTCQHAVAAAWDAVSNRVGITSAEFTMGVMCLPEMACPGAPPNTGQVVFHRTDGTGVYVTVQSDASGTVRPEPPAVWPSPSPS